MEKQDKEDPKPQTGIMTGAHIAPKGHGTGCPCCIPEDDEE